MEIRNVTIAGGGVLGSQIALQSAYCGFNVKIWLRSEGSIGRCTPKLDRFAGIYKATLEATKENPGARARGLSDEGASVQELDELIAKVDPARASIVLTTDWDEAFGEADLVIEAVAEDPAQKIEFYQELAKHLPEKTVIVTNSSTLLPSQFAAHTGRPEKYLALHFANNIWMGNTAEVMNHAGTDMQYYDQIVRFAQDIRMVPLCLHKEQPGYILNSMLVPFLSAAEALYANDVADPETIDKTWTLATGAPNGPFRILDVVGLVTAYNIVTMNPQAADPNSTPGRIAAKLKEKIDAGKTGINAGEGFYKYR
ncbi:MAG: 3-hydroxyacyl-CoA dehydrogenase [Coriobacteriales bacterium]|nr:3-hydroxyacyl-CoA dehydrogenase [Coriobacteriales bacterium]